MPIAGGRQVSSWVVLAALLAACSSPPPGPEPTLETRIDRGLSCVALAYDGNSFRDDYLKYRYPKGEIESPLPGDPITYRILDAYFIVLMLRQAGIGRGDARLLFDRAEAVTAALAPAWHAKGIYNLRRNPAPDGIALDTYAILAVLRGDAVLSGVVAAGLDGDGWLAADFYKPREAFRRLADESWAARALLVSDPARGRAVIEGLSARAVEEVASASDLFARANLVIHVLEAAADPRLPAAGGVSTGGGAGAAGTGLAVSLAALESEGRRLLDETAIQSDPLTLANLLGALETAPDVPVATLDPAARLLARRQEEDGCWSASGKPGDRYVRIFATLRVLLTLGRHAARLGAAGPS